PYQGLKPQNKLIDLHNLQNRVAINPNPYQGLKPHYQIPLF
ncbi:MAG: hypothetical protein RLZZ338_4879, partial [Cyanobacteriota bacterium]